MASFLPKPTISIGLVFVCHRYQAVVPEGTDVKVKREGQILTGPGIGDDARGLAVLLAITRALNEAKTETKGDVVFVADVALSPADPITLTCPPTWPYPHLPPASRVSRGPKARADQARSTSPMGERGPRGTEPERPVDDGSARSAKSISGAGCACEDCARRRLVAFGGWVVVARSGFAAGG